MQIQVCLVDLLSVYFTNTAIGRCFNMHRNVLSLNEAGGKTDPSDSHRWIFIHLTFNVSQCSYIALLNKGTWRWDLRIPLSVFKDIAVSYMWALVFYGIWDHSMAIEKNSCETGDLMGTDVIWINMWTKTKERISLGFSRLVSKQDSGSGLDLLGSLLMMKSVHDFHFMCSIKCILSVIITMWFIQ